MTRLTKNRSDALKGQFYIIAALVLILFMFYARYNSRFSVSETVDYTQGFFENIKKETLRSVVYAYYAGQSSFSVESNVSSFMDFLRNSSLSHGQRMEAFVVVAIPEHSNFNMSVINFLGSAADFNVTVSGAENNVTNLADKGSARFVFNDVAGNATVNVTYVKGATRTSDVFNISAQKLGVYAEIKLVSSTLTWADKVYG